MTPTEGIFDRFAGPGRTRAQRMIEQADEVRCVNEPRATYLWPFALGCGDALAEPLDLGA